MRSSRISIVLITAALTCQPVHVQDEEEQLRATEQDRLRSLVEADMDIARRLHADDFQLVDPSGATLTKDQYLGRIASGELDYVVWEPGPMAVRRFVDVVVLRYQARAQAVVAGKRTPLLSFWHTDVYEKRDGRWQVVWSQATLIQ